MARVAISENIYRAPSCRAWSSRPRDVHPGVRDHGRRASVRSPSAGLLWHRRRAGAAVLAFAPLTGAGFNPARAFGPDLVGHIIDDVGIGTSACVHRCADHRGVSAGWLYEYLLGDVGSPAGNGRRTLAMVRLRWGRTIVLPHSHTSPVSDVTEPITAKGPKR